ncbi:FAD-dependent monooxygenase [Candidatus Saccharibacteria bacterium]|nr:FAD-dependent monooxygenase [Candidatus Saccharibacteria bacterium]MBH2007098.1 FAD-dependent monooxygenase [Candidatus Saccharibacteria bacterium]
MSNSTHTESRKKVLIVGAGVAGLSLAILLEKQAVAFDIVERSSEAKPQGYSITLPSAGLDVLNQLGIYEDILAAGKRVHGVHIDSDEHIPGRLIKLENIVTVRRSDLYQCLLDQLRSPVHFDTMPTRYITQADGKTLVTCSDGTSRLYDLVVGADGMHSRVRNYIFPEAQPKPVGVAYWTFFAEAARIPTGANYIAQTWKRGKFVGMFPLPSSTGIVLSAYISPDTNLDTIDIEALFGDTEHPIGNILRTFDPSIAYKGHLKEVNLESWSKGNFVLIGDAAHAMTPATGMGATAGLLDAVELSRALTSFDEWSKALRLYERARKCSAHRAQVRSRLITHAMLTDGIAGGLRKKAVRLLPERLFLRLVS